MYSVLLLNKYSNIQRIFLLNNHGFLTTVMLQICKTYFLCKTLKNIFWEIRIIFHKKVNDHQNNPSKYFYVPQNDVKK